MKTHVGRHVHPQGTHHFSTKESGAKRLNVISSSDSATMVPSVGNGRPRCSQSDGLPSNS